MEPGPNELHLKPEGLLTGFVAADLQGHGGLQELQDPAGGDCHVEGPLARRKTRQASGKS